MSAQSFRGQSKQNTTISNLLHPLLSHSCPNGSSLPRMTMNQVLTELFALYWCKTYSRLVPVTRFHLTWTLMGHCGAPSEAALSTSIDKIPKTMEILMEEALYPSNKITEIWSIYARKKLRWFGRRSVFVSFYREFTCQHPNLTDRETMICIKAVRSFLFSGFYW